MQPSDRINPDLAIDLGERPQELSEDERALREAAAEARKQESAADYAQRWDKAMKHAFKGIYTRAERHRALGVGRS